MTPFTFDQEHAREHWATIPEGDGPFMGESPARTIDDLLYEALASDIVECAEGWALLVYALVYDSDPDGILIVVENRNRKPWLRLAGYSLEWDEVLSRDAYASSDGITFDQWTDMLDELVRQANMIAETAPQGGPTT